MKRLRVVLVVLATINTVAYWLDYQRPLQYVLKYLTKES
jgi:hypothetical protein